MLMSLSLLVFAALPRVQEPSAVHHDLRVRIAPQEHRLEVQDAVTLPAALLEAGGPVRLRLHAQLGAPAAPDGIEVLPIDAESASAATAGVGEHGAAPVRTFELRPAGGGTWPADRRVRLVYGGAIDHELVAEEQEYARSFARSAGTIGPEGVVLSGSSFWIPDFGGALVTFRLDVELPEGWQAVSQGDRIARGGRRVTWLCAQPMDEAYLVAGQWTEYSRPAGDDVTAFAFLRQPDPELAERYLAATAEYLDLYGRLIGPYPFTKFALVENFWETGYGMPSFTLLGSQVIRLPFILQSSYPHEILHNWWGNSVFVAVEQGNWCEGLTAYLADHLIAESQGRGEAYRRDTLKRYRDFVRDAVDFPLTQFRSRHSSATEAVGYGKALMLFHMLRLDLGDETFTRGLRQLYDRERFQRASWGDLTAVFGEVAGRDLGPWFAQWLERTGAPELELGDVTIEDAGRPEAVRVTFELRQVQADGPYHLRVPVAIGVAGRQQAVRDVIALDDRALRASIEVPGAPVSLQVDPGFDVFRRLDRSELPPTLGQLFGAPRVTIVLPGADDPLADAWRALAESWSRGESADVALVSADELGELPVDRAVWVLGDSNRYREAVRASIAGFGAAIDGERIEFGAQRVTRADHAFAVVGPHPRDPELAIGWIGADRAAAVPGLARKLPHYGKYSYLAFAGDEPTNDAKGQWTSASSALCRRLERDAPLPVLPPSEPLMRVESSGGR
ncbi:MAG: M1 family peptidase [Planctomycetes bacterium]|nr:M1 family peptidase [Planctomycetota bacterium]